MPVPGMPKECFTPRELNVVRAPRGPIEMDVPRFPMLMVIPGSIFILLWNLKPTEITFLYLYTLYHKCLPNGEDDR